MQFTILVGALGQDCPNSGFGSVNLHNKLPGGVRLNEDGNCQEVFLEVSEGGFCHGGPTEWPSGTVISDEVPVKIHKAQKLLQLTTVSGSRPLDNHMELLRVSHNLAQPNTKPQEGYRLAVKETFFGLNEQPILQQALENRTDMNDVRFKSGGKDQNVR